MRWHVRKSCWQQDIKLQEYILAAVKGNLLLLILVFLFYHSAAAYLILFIPGNLLYLRQWQSSMFRQKEQAFQIQFRDAMQALADALKVGYAVENAVQEAWKSLGMLYSKDCRICREFRHMVNELQMNRPVEQVLEEMADRTEQEDVAALTTVLVTAKKNGGDLVQILRQTIRQLCDKVEVRREIEVLCASRRLEFRVMCCIPAGMIAYMKLSFPEFMSVLYGNAFGVIFMSACLGVYAVAYVLGEKLTEIRV